MRVELPELLLPDATVWRAWLQANHASSPGVWLVLHRKGGAITSLTYEQAVLEALCFGWIDGQAARRDEQSYRQRMTRRTPRSPWSQHNVERVARLEREGRMTPAGRAAVDAAKADGRWAHAYAGPEAMEVPEDLGAALAASPAARAAFDSLSSTNRYAILYRTHTAKRAETRARRIAEFVAMLERGETVYPQRRSVTDQ